MTAPDVTDDEEETSATDAPHEADDADAPNDTFSENVFTHKMVKSMDDNPMGSLGYECRQCTFEQWLSIDPPEGWSKGPAQVIAFTRGALRSKPTIEGVPSSVDFLEEVPGNEYELIVRNLDGRIIEATGDRMVIEVEVIRDTLMQFEAGKRVHELTDPDGNVFVLFAYGVDPENVVVPDFENPYFMGLFSPPVGWTYTSRILEEELSLDTSDVATVLAIRGELTSTWEKR